MKSWVGKRFGKLVVKALSGRRNGSIFWLCVCDCGEEVIKRHYSLSRRNQLHCGCSPDDEFERLPRKNAEYHVWKRMHYRCQPKKGATYRYHGALGVTVCERWRSGENGRTGYECFLEDMGNRPSDDHSIDRINPYGNYTPENCRWATNFQQCQNKRRFFTKPGVVTPGACI